MTQPTPAMIEAAARALYNDKWAGAKGMPVNFNATMDHYRGQAEAALTAALALAEDGWQPIETAPQDEPELLLWHGRRNIGGWTDRHYDMRYEQKPSWVINGGYVVQPTKWMLLPSPPEEP